GADFVKWSSAPDDCTLGVVDFSIFPHLDAFPENTMADAERWAADIGVPAYAIDEQTAIKVVDGSVEVISEGQWTKFGCGAPARPMPTPSAPPAGQRRARTVAALDSYENESATYRVDRCERLLSIH